MAEPTNRAVFLSYAREDAAAARQIAEALRTVGVEAWFDLSELRGGDDWDAKIKRQIRECTLFVPIVSAHTQAREEGYFRREWLLAVERKRDMADSRAFIVPVIIDDTQESAANVPEQFLKAHCTRLPGGEPTPEFIAQVKRLLQGPRAADNGSRPATSAAVPLIIPTARPRVPLWSVALGVGLVALAAFLFFRSTSNLPKVPEPVAPAASVANEKSIAVLPFVNMSGDASQEFFSDGISEELLNQLAKVPALQVTSRSSAFAFKGAKIDLTDVAAKLHVAHVLEGSVRKSGNKIRITAQLIDARTDTHLWSETYDRSLDDIFAVQDEIAGAVVEQLKIKLLGAAPKAKVVNPEAYALFLQARQLRRQNTREGIEQAIALDKQVLALDPGYTMAWTNLAACYTNQGSFGLRPVDEAYKLAREAANQALALDPNDALGYDALGWIAMNYDGDLAAAARHYQHALGLEPTNLVLIANSGTLAVYLGRLDTATRLQEWVSIRDPLSTAGYANLAAYYFSARRFEESVATYRIVLRLSPSFISGQAGLGQTLLYMGKLEAALTETLKEPDEAIRLNVVAMIYHALGQRAQAEAALNELIAKHGKDAPYLIAEIYAYRNEADHAFEWLEKAVIAHDTSLPDILTDLMLGNLSKDPRWLPFLRKLGLAPEQVAAIKFDVKFPEK